MHEVNLAEEAEKIAETHDNFSGIIYSGLPGLMVISKKAYDAISDSFFLVAWISDTLAVGWRSISYLMSNNKNSHNTGDLILDWLLFGVGALFTFASAALLAILQVIGTAVMFIIYPFMSMAKSLYYLAKTITADTLGDYIIQYCCYCFSPACSHSSGK